MTAVYLNQLASLASQARSQPELTTAYLSRIGTLIREAREQRGVSHVELAARPRPSSNSHRVDSSVGVTGVRMSAAARPIAISVTASMVCRE